MKLTFFILFALFLQVGATGYAQQQKVSLNCVGEELGKVFKHLEKQTELYFFFNEQALDTKKKVSVTVTDEELGKVLEEILGADYTWEVVNDLIVVQPVVNAQTHPTTPKRVHLRGQVVDRDKHPLPGVTIQVKGVKLGTATDANGRFNFHIMELRSTILVFSFIGMETLEYACKGEDSLQIVMYEAVNEMDEVVITGYQKIDKRHLTSAVTTLKVDDIYDPAKNTIDQMLESHVPGLVYMQNSGQVGVAPKLRIRGSSTVLGNREPLWVVDGIIQQDPVTVDPAKLNDPDFVNLLGNAIGGLNPEDIEQIDVLKDASATALYGTRAANGVIVVTTKKGKVGAPQVSYSFSGTFSRRPHYSDKQVNLMNSAERINFSRELIQNKQIYPSVESWIGYEGTVSDYWNGLIGYDEFQNRIGYYETLNTDWFDLLTRNSFTNTHTLSVSGGSSAIRYYASVGFSDMNGVLKGEGNDRYTGNLKITANHNKWNFQFGMSGVLLEKEYDPQDLGLLNYAYRMNRAVPAFTESGDYWYYDKASQNNTYRFNILNEIENSSDTQEQHQIQFNTTVDYRLLPVLKLGMTFAYSQSDFYNETYRGEKTYYASSLRKAEFGAEMTDSEKMNAEFPAKGGELMDRNERKQNWVARLQADFNQFMDKEERHLISATLGGELSSTRSRGSERTIRGYVPERGMIINPPEDSFTQLRMWMLRDPAAIGSRKDELSNITSLYMALTYSYRDAFIFNVNTRMDGSNQFGSRSNEKLLPVWSLSGRWNMKENVWKSANFVNDMALRVSFGFQGNVPAGGPDLIISKKDWQTNLQYYGSDIASYPNPNLGWERTMSINVGLDFSLWRNKITGSISYFYKKTKDAFLNKTISSVNGMTSYTVNSGILENQGYELSFRFTPIDNMGSMSGDKKGFRWTFDPHIGQVLNKLLDKALNNKEKIVRDKVTYRDYLTGQVDIAGKPLDTFFSYKFAGLNPTDGRPTYHGIPSPSVSGKEPADEEIKLLMEKFKLMTPDEVFMEVMEHSGTRTPFIQGALSNTFSYRQLVLSFTFGYSLGSKVRLLTLYDDTVDSYGTLAPQPHRNLRTEYNNRWRRPGDEMRTNMPGILENEEFKRTMGSGRWWSGEPYEFADNIWQMYDDSNIRVVSGNYLKLQNVSLRYVIPGKVCQKMYMKSAYVSVSSSNLFTICSKKLKGQSPTQSGTSPNINLSLCPSFSMSLNVSF